MTRHPEQPIPDLIIGVGNDMRSDDGAGIYVSRKLHKTICDIPIKEASGEGAALMEAWRDVSHVIVIDAVRSGAEAGTIHRLNAHTKPLPSDFFNYSTHAFSVAEAVEMSRALGRLPQSLLIYGIEGAAFDYGTTMSPAVQEAADQIVRELSDQFTLPQTANQGDDDHA